MSDTPRRCNILENTLEELAIRNCIDLVEQMGCDTRLTDAVVMLSAAHSSVADFVDSFPRRNQSFHFGDPADQPQPMPTGTGEDVNTATVILIRNLKKSFNAEDSTIADQVCNDLMARIAMGERKYGVRLRTNNGRDALMDAYQEALDGIHYAMQWEMEGHGSEALLLFLRLSFQLQREIGRRRENPDGK